MTYKKKLKKQMVGFGLTSFLSTMLMFGIYVGLKEIIYYQYAYVIAFSTSVLTLYFMNIWVFKGHISIDTFLKFIAIYCFQYVISALLLGFLVKLGFSATFAPLLVLVVLLPVIFVFNKIVLGRR